MVRWMVMVLATALAAAGGYGVAYAANAIENDPTKFRALRTVLPEKPEPVLMPPCTQQPLPLVLISGSSTMEMWGSSVDDLAPLNTINIGVGGTTLKDQLVFLRPIVTKFKPDVIVMFAGANDIAASTTPTALVDELHTYIDEMKAQLPDTVLYFVSINTAPSRVGNGQAIRTANSTIAAESSADGVLRFIDTERSLIGADGKPNSKLFGPDGLHLNEAGYDVFAKIIGDRLKADGFDSSDCINIDGTIEPPAGPVPAAGSQGAGNADPANPERSG